jgi:outer membrane protein assembly factor BamD
MKRLAAMVLLALAFAACSGNKKPDKITRDLLSLPKEQIFEKGKALLAKRKYEQGRKYLNFVFESYPNDPLGQQALLLVADSFFSRGGPAAYVEARYRYRDYLTRYPSAPNRDFVLYRYAVCYDKEHLAPDRDPTNTREALGQYQKLLEEASTSPYAAEAQGRIRALRDELAEHEFGVGYFYFRKGNPSAALARFLEAEQRFPEYDSRDRLLYYTARALERLDRKEEAQRYYGKLEAAFPKSPWALRSRKENHISVDKGSKTG